MTLKLVVSLISIAAVLLSALPARAQQAEVRSYDVVVYGGTASAVVAAIAADRMGLSVALVSPDTHLGGLTSSGLGWTDSKNGDAIGGLAREFYHRIWKYYTNPAAWTRVTREEYARRVFAQPGTTVDDQRQVMWTFEPHVAERVFDQWLAETNVDVHRDEWLDRASGVDVADQRIQRIRTLSGRTYEARVFIDATYEGDLMAAAGVTYRVGRDSAAEFGESLNGIYFERPDARYYKDKAYEGISPYIVPGDPSSGFIAGVEGEMPSHEKPGDADKRLQSFNYRLCLTADESNRTPITRPDNYDEADYELLLRLYEAGHPSGFSTQEMPNLKTDSNDQGIMSFDFVGGNFDIEAGWVYSEMSYADRRKVAQAHRDYQMGLLWTIMNHPRVPEDARRKWSRYGLAADEFQDNGNWPRQMYVREARRMVGVMMMTQHHVERRSGYGIDDSIGQGSYSLDSHVVRRVVIDGVIRNEGGFYYYWDKPYPISYRAIVPRRDEIQNLLVPVTLSATHVAFGSLRMEPTYMILGHSAATAAAVAIERNVTVQDVPYDALRTRLIEQGQVLGEPAPPPADGILRDDSEAMLLGEWQTSATVRPFIGSGYAHDNNQNKGLLVARFEVPLENAGLYEVRFAYSPHLNRATNVPVSITHRGGVTRRSVDQKKRPPIGNHFVSLGTFEFADKAIVEIRNDNTDGYVTVDGLQLVPVTPADAQSHTRQQ